MSNPPSARDTILRAIRRAGVPVAAPAPPPVERADPQTNAAQRAHFCSMLHAVGGIAIEGSATEVDAALRARLFPTTPAEDRTTVLILRGHFGVVENGAVYLDATALTERVALVRAEHLVLRLPASALVPTMHDAVRRMSTTATCGWFLSGPSKTADIEQSLVIGAQGARTLHVVLED